MRGDLDRLSTWTDYQGHLPQDTIGAWPLTSATRAPSMSERLTTVDHRRERELEGHEHGEGRRQLETGLFGCAFPYWRAMKGSTSGDRTFTLPAVKRVAEGYDAGTEDLLKGR